VDWLADRGFPVERGAIVGVGLRSVERLAGRMTAGRAAFVGAAAGIVMGALVALLVGVLPWGSGSAETLTSVVGLGALFGAGSGALLHEARSGGRRDFISATRIEADRYELQVDEGAADDAGRLLAAMPAPQ
jgi:hypothetical protein